MYSLLYFSPFLGDVSFREVYISEKDDEIDEFASPNIFPTDFCWK